MSDFRSMLLRGVARLLSFVLPGKLGAVAKLLAVKPPRTPKGRVAVTVDASVQNLHAKVDHIVVLMLENRSFDHMLGYLTLEGARHDIDGLTGNESNLDLQGVAHPVYPLGGRTAFESEAEDPDHSGASVDEQLEEGNGGFVRNFARYSAGEVKKLEAQGHKEVPLPPARLVMGYYTAEQLPVYDYLAREFCVCDRWFSSVPGATWPNRLYAVAGRAEDNRDDREPPLYELPAFVRHLDEQAWRWYSFDPATLRCADPAYRFSHHEHFAFVDKRKLTIPEKLEGRLTEGESSFLEDAAEGRLPAVSWIDPRFKDLTVLGPDSNDDHPPSDVTAGQHLVLSVYHALRTSPAWEKTLLIVTYDEHGGFYDHVPPLELPGEKKPFGRYGVRVPAFVISPYVEAGSVAQSVRDGSAHKTVFDHTSIIKTILLRNCLEQAGGEGGAASIPDMSPRVNAAEHIGGLLTRATPRTDAEVGDYNELIESMQQWSCDLQAGRFARELKPPSPPRPLTDLQNGFYKAARLLRHAGLPAGHP